MSFNPDGLFSDGAQGPGGPSRQYMPDAHARLAEEEKKIREGEALIDACIKGYTGKATALIEMGVDPKFVSKAQKIECKYGVRKEVMCMVHYNATPVMAAIVNRRSDILLALFSAGKINPNAIIEHLDPWDDRCWSKETLLHKAAKISNNVAVINVLLEAGADVDITAAYDERALSCCCRSFSEYNSKVVKIWSLVVCIPLLGVCAAKVMQHCTDDPSWNPGLIENVTALEMARHHSNSSNVRALQEAELRAGSAPGTREEPSAPLLSK